MGIEIVAVGYAPATAAVNAGESAVVELMPAPVLLDSMKATSSRVDRRDPLVGFEARRLTGNGHFLTEREIADMWPTKNEDLVRRIPGIRAITKRGGLTPAGIAVDSTFVVRAGKVAFENSRATCKLDIFVDGIRRSPEDLKVIQPSSLRGFEVHDASSMPPQFKGGVFGGILLWMKR